jgi:hypothetical protein
LVLNRRDCVRSLRILFPGLGAVLMSLHNSRVDHRVFIVGIGGQGPKQPLPDAAVVSFRESGPILRCINPPASSHLTAFSL